MRILLTGAAGFIGFHAAARLIEDGHAVLGLDSCNDYYDPALKYARLSALGIDPDALVDGVPQQSATHPGFSFVRMQLEDAAGVTRVLADHPPEAIVHLAAQVGVRYSVENPSAYINSNLVGFLTILEAARAHKVDHLVYASSSSVYGANTEQPFSTEHRVDHPVSLYAATKRSNELMAHSYAHLYGIPMTGLRFFTVYGPWGRPDMALFTFVRRIAEGQAIDVYNHGDMSRDFTYVDDIIEGIVRVLASPPMVGPNGEAPARLYNIGNTKPAALMDFIGAIETAMGRKAQKNLLPMQPGDVPTTWADCSRLAADHGYRPGTSITEGVQRFWDWYRDFYGAE